MDLQNVLVSLVALVAVGVLVRRLTGVGRTSSAPACANCPSAAGSCQTAAPSPSPPPAAPSEHPLVFVRSARH